MSTGVLEDALSGNRGEYILLVEGTVPTRGDGLYCVVGTRNGKPYTALEAVRELGAAAARVVAVGTCASFGALMPPGPTRHGEKAWGKC